MNASDTIFALSSGLGRAAVAVIRVSGPQAGAAVLGMAGSLPCRRRAALRLLSDPIDGAMIDQAMVLWMPGPNSATGEDIAEFHVHGSAAVVDKVFAVLMQLPATRLAEAGEFTRRAFAHGKLDLVEAEGLADLLAARTEEQRKLAIHHMSGAASSAYEGWRSKMLAILAYLESGIDFADEEGVATAALSKVRPLTESLVAELGAAVLDGERAGRLRDGIRIVFAGAPNVGKSSLLNALARKDAAIVSQHAGTTRDIIEVPAVLAGVPVIFTDTAGLREDTTDEVEAIGISRTTRALEQAEISVWVLAADCPQDLRPPIAPDLIIQNKSDLEGLSSIHIRNDKALNVSALTGEGLDSLVGRLTLRVTQLANVGHQADAIRPRHVQALQDSIRLLNESLTYDADRLEMAAECVRGATVRMAQITGRIHVEDLLGHIFAEFCIGK
jgi:tRNA modification GTPase